MDFCRPMRSKTGSVLLIPQILNTPSVENSKLQSLQHFVPSIKLESFELMEASWKFERNSNNRILQRSKITVFHTWYIQALAAS